VPAVGAAADRRGMQRAGARQREAASGEPRAFVRRDEVRKDGGAAIGERFDRARDDRREAAYAKSPG
jgi:hypothetical protein